MRNKHIIVLVFACVSLIGNAQGYNLKELLMNRQYETIIDYAKMIPATDTVDYESMNIIGQAYEGLLRNKEAYSYYENCYKYDTLNIDVLNALARTSLNLGKASGAAYFFKKVLTQDSLNFYANYQLARLHFQIGDYENALIRYQYLSAKNSENVTLLKSEGDCFMKLENPYAATESYTQAYNLNKENALLGYTLVNTMLSIGGDLIDKALAVCDTALLYNPGNRALEQCKGMAFYMNEKYPEADSLYSALIAKGDSSYLTLKFGGISRYYAGQYFRVIEPLEAVYKKDTTSAEVCLFLGSAYSKMFELKQAYLYYNKSEENMKPPSALVSQLAYFRAETYMKDKRFNEAASLYYNLWKSNPKRLDLLWYISSIYTANNQSEYKNNSDRQRGLFSHVLYVTEYLKTGENPVQVAFAKELLKSFFEDAFFRNITELPMLSPEGEKSTIAVQNLSDIIKQIPDPKIP